MSDPLPFDLGRMIPGFDFFQGLTGDRSPGAGAATSGLNHWIAPTVDIDELERRISELKAVQFWLEQSLLGMKATIQALEVQKMTLAALRSMNLSVTDVAKAFTLPTSGSATGKSLEGWPFASKTEQAPAAAPTGAGGKPAGESAPSGAAATGSGKKQGGASQSVLDPMQWWGALTQQFQQIARQTLKEAAQTGTGMPGRGLPKSPVTGKPKAPRPKRAATSTRKKPKKPATSAKSKK